MSTGEVALVTQQSWHEGVDMRGLAPVVWVQENWQNHSLGTSEGSREEWRSP